ncbi:mavicyanin-like [Telopea speciosissima]|uniref:mavicyanin-like n=1 Tax=Telopea speciosissima TaxID=54955 RepID=UPI001CC517A7|nr:mavicyanin-like [Telopea speciosissima]
MAYKLLFFYVLACLCLQVLTCNATVYMVGDNSGWDVSTDLNSWVKGKTFNVGDSLLFQYSSGNTVNEVTRNNFNACNVTQAIQIYTGGNTTIPLTQPGDRFFVCGNKLYCFGGMKLQVHVNGAQGVNAPATAPGLAPQASTNNNNASPNFSTSNGSPYGGRGSLIFGACVGAIVTLLFGVII